MRGDNWSFGIHVEGHSPDEDADTSFDRIGPHYFETLGTRLLRGRTTGDEDTPSSREVAVVNQTFVRKFFPKQDPIGKHFRMGAPSHSGDIEIVGVVEDTKYQDARGPAYPTFFMPFLQMSKDPKMAILDFMTMNEQVTRNFNQDRLIARLTELFGGLALILACVGLYGVTAYAVAQRTGEIGIRMALGADRPRILGLVLRGALWQLGVGLAIGIPVALAGGRLLANQLYGVKSYEPAILVLAAVILTACALVAGFVPAQRAASIDPIRALRVE